MAKRKTYWVRKVVWNELGQDCFIKFTSPRKAEVKADKLRGDAAIQDVQVLWLYDDMNYYSKDHKF